MYLDLSSANRRTIYTTFDYRNNLAELSNFKIIEKWDYSFAIQDKFLQNRYTYYYNNSDYSKINYSKDTIYTFNTPRIEKTTLKTGKRQVYYLSDMYEISGLLNDPHATLDIIDKRIYIIDPAGITSYDKNFGDIKFIIDNTNILNNNSL